MAATLSEGVKKLFLERNFAHLATLMADGSPQVTPVWVDQEGERIVVNTAEGRVKPANVRRDPRVAISVYNQENPYSAAFVRGRVAEVRSGGAEAHIHKMAQKYMGQERYPNLQPGEQRLLLIIEPEYVGTMMVD
ncbi:MAG: PPOX class F420-dependent oxidoreductase [Dehalococcoidia bacterium]